MAEQSVVIGLAIQFGATLARAASYLENFSTDDLGTNLPPAVSGAAPVTSAVQSVQAAARELGTAASDLSAAASGGADTQLIAGLLRFGDGLGRLFISLDKLSEALSAAITAGAIPDAAERTRAQAMADELPRALADHIVVSFITRSVPAIGYLLKLAGLIDWTRVPSTAGSPSSRTYIRRRLRLDRFKTMISDPGAHFTQAFGWGSPTFDPTDFFEVYANFFGDESAVEIGVEAGDPFLDTGLVRIKRRSDLNPPGLQMIIEPSFETDLGVRGEITPQWGISLDLALKMAGEAGATITPPLNFEITPPQGEISGTGRLFVDRNPTARPFAILDGTGLITITAQNASFGMGLKADWDSSSGSARFTPLVFSDLTGVTLQLGSENADGFIAQLLSSADIKGEFSLGLEWRPDTGLRVKASGGIEIALPIHRAIGPINLDVLYFAVRIGNDGTLSTEASAALAANLGPLQASVDRIGALLDVRFAEGGDADLGPLDLSLRFKPPNGIGLAIDASVVKGGGYLYFDFDKEEYAGALELVIQDFLSLKAIGLLTTRLPDGSKGFSLLIIITAEFSPGVQLGYGFVLVGVGGLLGLNRTVKIQALAEGVRTGAVNGILFPRDLIANAPRIISDLRAIFPPERDRFLIGPMAKLGWGTPTLITLSLGVVIEIPGNIAILGVLQLALPTPDEPVLNLQVNFIGAIEFDKARLFFFAAIFDSRLLFITLEGEMGVLAAFGADANFVVSVGGFHPRFSPPPLPFPSPKRIALKILDESWGRIRAETYFALTTNTAQLGMRAELWFGFSEFAVEGSIGLDALLQFSPFYLIVEASASVSLKAFGVGVFSLKLEFTLEGPTPWRAHGRGSISLLFFDISADFDERWGETIDTTLPAIAVMPTLVTEFEKVENWQAVPPEGNTLLVSLRRLDLPAGELVLHPVGTLRISQRGVPLDLTIDRVGAQRPSDARKFSVRETTGTFAKRSDAAEPFAPAQFQDMSDAEKLSRPAFSPQNSGIELTAQGAELRVGALAKRNVRYEEIIVDTVLRRVRPFREWFGGLFAHFLKGSSVAASKLSKSHRTQFKPRPDAIVVKGDTYAVANVADNSAFAANTVSFTSEASAREFLLAQVKQDRNAGESLHVIPSTELKEAA